MFLGISCEPDHRFWWDDDQEVVPYRYVWSIRVPIPVFYTNHNLADMHDIYDSGWSQTEDIRFW